MRRLMLILGVLAFVASPALAIPTLQDIGTPTDGGSTHAPTYVNHTIARPYSITSDGKFVGGIAYDPVTSAVQVGFLYKVSTDTNCHVMGGGINTDVTGVGYTSTGAIMANGKDSGWASTNISYNDGYTWTKKRYTSLPTTSYAYSMGSFNTAAGVPSTTNSDGNGAIGNTYGSMWDNPDGGGLYAGGITSTDGQITPINMKGVPGTSKYLGGISSEGIAVGRRDGNNYIVDVGATYGGSYFRGLNTTSNTGQAYDISDDGLWAVGWSATDSNGNRAYLKDLSGSLDALATELPGLPGAGATYAYGISGGGEYATGISWSSTGGERAVLWDLTGATPTVTDLTAFAISQGIMGNFTDLYKPYAVAMNADGAAVVAGRGTTAEGEVGWVLTTPEPATLSFLVLGGLALLRRRR